VNSARRAHSSATARYWSPADCSICSPYALHGRSITSMSENGFGFRFLVPDLRAAPFCATL
jgi:hypothetical protein